MSRCGFHQFADNDQWLGWQLNGDFGTEKSIGGFRCHSGTPRPSASGVDVNDTRLRMLPANVPRFDDILSGCMWTRSVGRTALGM